MEVGKADCYGTMIENEQIITVTCVCGEKAVMKFCLGDMGGTSAKPYMPDGWQEIAGSHICPKHTIQVLMDGDIIFSQERWKEQHENHT